MTNFEKVGLFMKTFGQEVKTNAGFSSDKINKLRIDLIEEELNELKAGVVFTSWPNVVINRPTFSKFVIMLLYDSNNF